MSGAEEPSVSSKVEVTLSGMRRTKAINYVRSDRVFASAKPEII